MIGVDCDYRALHNGESLSELLVVDTLFTLAFVCELALRIFADGWDFVHAQHRSWNLFDCFVVMVSIADSSLLSYAAVTGREINQRETNFKSHDP